MKFNLFNPQKPNTDCRYERRQRQEVGLFNIVGETLNRSSEPLRRAATPAGGDLYTCSFLPLVQISAADVKCQS